MSVYPMVLGFPNSAKLVTAMALVVTLSVRLVKAQQLGAIHNKHVFQKAITPSPSQFVPQPNLGVFKE